jgi:hypothetical protein
LRDDGRREQQDDVDGFHRVLQAAPAARLNDAAHALSTGRRIPRRGVDRCLKVTRNRASPVFFSW